MLELIHLVRPHLTPQLGSLAFLIHQYTLAVEEAIASISRKPGATRVKPPPANLLDSMGWCALTICEVWRTCQGRYPGEKNPKAQEAADLLWDAVLGTPSKLKPERWARHLARAKKCEDWQTYHIRDSLDFGRSELSSVPTELARFSSVLV